MMKAAIIVLTILPLVCLMISAILYIKNRSRYQKLIDNFQKEHTFTNPYWLYSTMVFLLSFTCFLSNQHYAPYHLNVMWH